MQKVSIRMLGYGFVPKTTVSRGLRVLDMRSQDGGFGFVSLPVPAIAFRPRSLLIAILPMAPADFGSFTPLPTQHHITAVWYCQHRTNTSSKPVLKATSILIKPPLGLVNNHMVHID
jgi:hypothetical protein